jgi:plasmid stabilization system protein ParE
MPKNLEHSLDFIPQAREDVRAIVIWYKSEVEGLEDRFLLSLKNSINSLIKNPLIYQVNFGSIRSLLLQRFPYRVYYFVEGNSIKIIGVVHTKRSPKFIRKRLM